MAENISTDLRIQKTREAIYKAIKEMICEMDADKITIKELTERARIHRKTFYLHYTCIEALFEDLLQQVVEEYCEEIDKIPIDAPFTEVNRVFFEFMARQEPYIEKLVCSPSYQEFADKLFLSSKALRTTSFTWDSHILQAIPSILSVVFTSLAVVAVRYESKRGALQEVISKKTAGFFPQSYYSFLITSS